MIGGADDRLDHVAGAACARRLRHSTPDEVRAAARRIASEASDADECRDLLEMLGILPQQTPQAWQSHSRYGHGVRHRIDVDEREAS